MKRLILYALAIIMGVVVGYMALKAEYTTVEENVGKEVAITYQTVNVREEPNGEIVGQLNRNDKVVLTGTKCDLKNGGPAELELWVEIQYGGGTAWITQAAIK